MSVLMATNAAVDVAPGGWSAGTLRVKICISRHVFLSQEYELVMKLQLVGDTAVRVL